MHGKLIALAFILPLVATAADAQGGAAKGTLAERIGHYDPAKMTRHGGGHNGPGTMEVGNILQGSARGGSLSTNFMMLQVGLINPRGGIAQHFHYGCEELFIILDGPDAEFTVNGRTSAIPTP